MTKEEAAANLSGEELETYNNYYAEVRDGVLKMQELAQLMIKDVEKADGIEPKTKGQRKRDTKTTKRDIRNFLAEIFICYSETFFEFITKASLGISRNRHEDKDFHLAKKSISLSRSFRSITRYE